MYLRGVPNYDFATYRHMVHDITEKFNNISQGIIEIEQKFQENRRSSIADVIRKIQLGEKRKLELVSCEYRLQIWNNLSCWEIFITTLVEGDLPLCFQDKMVLQSSINIFLFSCTFVWIFHNKESQNRNIIYFNFP